MTARLIKYGPHDSYVRLFGRVSDDGFGSEREREKIRGSVGGGIKPVANIGQFMMSTHV